MAFSSLLYTECRGDQSVHGREGMQFQAESLEATPEMEQAVVSHLLYRPDTELMSARAPSSAYPLSFTYRRIRDIHYLAVGRYLGRDSRGREGNQLTHCLATGDSEDIRPMRPAQLFGADAWLDRIQPTSDLPRVDAPLLVSEDFQPLALHAMALAQPGIERFLPALLTAFEQAAGAEPRKLLIAANDVETAVRWIALGSLFLDPRDVLDLSFRVFTDNPLGEDLSIAVFDPRTTRSAPSIRALPSVLNGVDLTDFTTSAIEPSHSALTYARWFVEHDVFDALDAIEVGRRWQAHLDSAETAIIAVSIACLGETDHPRLDATALAAVLATLSAHAPDDIDDYGSSLAEALLSVRPGISDDPGALHRAAVVLRRNDHLDVAEALTLALLEAARLYPNQYAARWARALTDDADPKATARWMDSGARGHAARMMTEILTGADITVLPDLFAVVPSLNCGVAWNDVRAAGQRLVDHWSSNPTAVRDVRRLAFRAQLEQMLWARLDSRIESGDVEVKMAVLSGEWVWLAGYAQNHESVPSALGATLTARAIRTAQPGSRVPVLRAYLARVERPEWRLFFPSNEPLDTELVQVWIAVLPRSLDDPAFARVVEEAVRDQLRRGTKILLAGLSGQPHLPAALARLTQDEALLDGWLAELGADTDTVPNPVVPKLSSLDHAILELNHDDILQRVLVQRDVDSVGRFLGFWNAAHLVDSVHDITLTYLQGQLRGFAPQLIAMLDSDRMPGWVTRGMTSSLRTWLNDPRNRKPALDVGKHDPELRARWYELISPPAKGRSAPSKNTGHAPPKKPGFLRRITSPGHREK